MIHRAQNLRARITRSIEESRGLMGRLQDAVSALFYEREVIAAEESARAAMARDTSVPESPRSSSCSEGTVRVEGIEVIGEWNGILVCALQGRHVGFGVACLQDGTTARHPGECGAVVIPRIVAIELGLVAA